MTGYRPDDDWSEPTTLSGERQKSGQVLLIWAALLGIPVAAGLIGHFSLARTMCLFFALAATFISALSFQALRTAIRRHYFEARQFRVHKAESPRIYSMYFGLHAVALPLFSVFAIICAAAVFVGPFTR
jgi:hypothetical protein